MHYMALRVRNGVVCMSRAFLCDGVCIGLDNLLLSLPDNLGLAICLV
jgi:hypothetical protein